VPGDPVRQGRLRRRYPVRSPDDRRYRGRPFQLRQLPRDVRRRLLGSDDRDAEAVQRRVPSALEHVAESLIEETASAT
jgi:hypothetical protein